MSTRTLAPMAAAATMAFLFALAGDALAVSCDFYPFVRTWGAAGTAPSQFQSPYGVALDAAGAVLVADTDNTRVQRFTTNGGFVRQWSTASGPLGISVDATGDVFVAGFVVEGFDSAGVPLSTFEPAPTVGARGVAVDSHGNLFVTDTSHQVTKFDHEGNVVTTWGEFGSALGQFDRPAGVAVDSMDHVFVVDGGNNRVQEFDNDGVFVAAWSTVVSGGFPRGFCPAGIAIDGNDDVFVTITCGLDFEFVDARVQKFSHGGGFIAGFGARGSANGMMWNPRGVAVNEAGEVFVADTENHRIQKFGCGHSTCGNGTPEPGEECDDGNTANDDGCSASCTLEPEPCGNGQLDDGEWCDEGAENGSYDKPCTRDCTFATIAQITTPRPSDTPGAPSEGVNVGNLELRGVVRRDPQIPLHVVYMVDAAVPADDPGNDCDGDGVGGGFADDFDNDHLNGTTLDCAISAVAALNAQVQSWPASWLTPRQVEPSIVLFAGDTYQGGAIAADMSNEPDVQPQASSPVADTNGDRISDVINVAVSIRPGGVNTFTALQVPTAGDGVEDALEIVSTLVDEDPDAAWVVLAIGAAGGDVSTSAASSLQALARKGVRINGYAVEAGGCASGTWLSTVSDAGTGACSEGSPSTADPSVPGPFLHVSAISLTVDGESVPVELDGLGRWRARANVEAGVCVATVEVNLEPDEVLYDTARFIATPANLAYVALGDSYSAGEGIDPFLDTYPGDFECHRSPKGYPRLVSRPFREESIAEDPLTAGAFDFAACSGAQSVDILFHGQFPGIVRQLDHVSPETDLITLTIGGNDVAFSDIVVKCAMTWPLDKTCADEPFKVLGSGRTLTLDEWATLRLVLERQDLRTVYRSLREASENEATIIVADYPHLITQQSSAIVPRLCLEEAALNYDERSWVRQKGEELSAVISSAATAEGVYFSSVIGKFAGHEVCDGSVLDGSSNEYMQGVSLSYSSYLDAGGGLDPDVLLKLLDGGNFHPNGKGAKAYAEVFNEKLAYLWEWAPNGRTLNGLPRNPPPQAALQSTADTRQPRSGGSGMSLDEAEALLAELGPDEINEIKSVRFGHLAVASVLSLDGRLPESCGRTAITGLEVAIAGGGFGPGAPVEILLTDGVGRKYQYPPIRAASDGSLWGTLTLPEIEANAVGSVLGIEAFGRGPNGEDVRLTGIMFEEASDSACAIDALAAGGRGDPTCGAASAAVVTAGQTVDGRNPQLKWKWKGNLDATELGDLTAGDAGIAVDVVDSGRTVVGFSIPSGGLCGKSATKLRPCWKRTKSGFTYANPVGPVQKMTVKTGPQGTVSLLAKAPGMQALSLPLAQSPSVSVSLRASNACWSSEFLPPAKKNTSTQFGDKVGG